MTDDTQKPQAGAVQVERVVIRDLNPMSTAPRDGTEILAYHKDGKNFHPISWQTRNATDWGILKRPYWGMRWHPDYSTQDGFYDGWIPYPELSV